MRIRLPGCASHQARPFSEGDAGGAASHNTDVVRVGRGIGRTARREFDAVKGRGDGGQIARVGDVRAVEGRLDAHKIKSRRSDKQSAGLAGKPETPVIGIRNRTVLQIDGSAALQRVVRLSGSDRIHDRRKPRNAPQSEGGVGGELESRPPVSITRCGRAEKNLFLGISVAASLRDREMHEVAFHAGRIVVEIERELGRGPDRAGKVRGPGLHAGPVGSQRLPQAPNRSVEFDDPEAALRRFRLVEDKGRRVAPHGHDGTHLDSHRLSVEVVLELVRGRERDKTVYTQSSRVVILGEGGDVSPRSGDARGRETDRGVDPGLAEFDAAQGRRIDMGLGRAIRIRGSRRVVAKSAVLEVHPLRASVIQSVLVVSMNRIADQHYFVRVIEFDSAFRVVADVVEHETLERDRSPIEDSISSVRADRIADQGAAAGGSEADSRSGVSGDRVPDDDRARRHGRKFNPVYSVLVDPVVQNDELAVAVREHQPVPAVAHDHAGRHIKLRGVRRLMRDAFAPVEGGGAAENGDAVARAAEGQAAAAVGGEAVGLHPMPAARVDRHPVLTVPRELISVDPGPAAVGDPGALGGVGEARVVGERGLAYRGKQEAVTRVGVGDVRVHDHVRRLEDAQAVLAAAEHAGGNERARRGSLDPHSFRRGGACAETDELGPVERRRVEARGPDQDVGLRILRRGTRRHEDDVARQIHRGNRPRGIVNGAGRSVHRDILSGEPRDA